jgi:hypothetical protein
MTEKEKELQDRIKILEVKVKSLMILVRKLEGKSTQVPYKPANLKQ